MPGLIGKKIGMTSMFDQDGKNLPCTVLEVGPCVVTQLKTVDTDGYEAAQLAYGDKKEKRTPKAMIGHFKKANTTPKSEVVEFKGFEGLAVGDEVKADLFEVGEYEDVVGTSKGKGFQGVVKRYNFAGVGQATHGQHNRLRAPGSIGNASTPSKVFKGMRMGGRMGSDRVKTQNLVVLKVDAEKNLIVVNGSVAGHKGATILIEK